MAVTDAWLDDLVVLHVQTNAQPVRELAFSLPAGYEHADIQTPVPAERQVRTDDTGTQVQVLLRDPLLEPFFVRIQHRRPSAMSGIIVPIPRIARGRVTSQFVGVENQCGDEIAVERAEGVAAVEAVDDDSLLALLKSPSTMRFRVTRLTGQPQLSVQRRQRERLTAANSSIGLTELVIRVAESGAYVAEQTWHVYNETELFLELALPPGAELQQACINGSLRQAMRGRQTGTQALPLLRSLKGDLDYPVSIRFVGRLASSGRRQLPVARVLNVPEARTFVTLQVPDGQRWWGFSGMPASDARGLGVQHARRVRSLSDRLMSVLGSSDREDRANALKQVSLMEIMYGKLKADGQIHDGGEAEQAVASAVDLAQQPANTWVNAAFIDGHLGAGTGALVSEEEPIAGSGPGVDWATWLADSRGWRRHYFLAEHGGAQLSGRIVPGGLPATGRWLVVMGACLLLWQVLAKACPQIISSIRSMRALHVVGLILLWMVAGLGVILLCILVIAMMRASRQEDPELQDQDFQASDDPV